MVVETQVPCSIDADCAMICQDDSMINSRISAGDLLYVRAQETVEDGKIAVILDGDVALVGRIWTYPDCLVLRPDNHWFPPRVYSGKQLEQIKILGRVVGFASANV